MPIATAYSTQDLPYAVKELKQRCGTCVPRVVIFFAATKYDPAALGAHMKRAFPNSLLVGCSTAGEIVDDHMLSGSVVAMFLDDRTVEDAAVAVIENIGADICLDEPLRKIETHFDTPLSALDLEKYVGVVLIDGLSGAEERLMEKLGDRTDLFVVGGSAGDDLRFQSTYVLADGEIHTNAAVLLVLRLKGGFDIIKTQSFRTTPKTLTATEVMEERRRVVQFNNKPALDAYCEAIGVAPDQAPGFFARHPLGLMVDGEPYVRSPQRALDRSMDFYCRIKQGMELTILDSTDIVADTRAAVDAKRAELGALAGIIDFHCILRTLQLREERRCGEYAAAFSGIPTVGFSTYGEQYLGHVNQTSTMLVFR
jgi:hypothetical protein